MTGTTPEAESTADSAGLSHACADDVESVFEGSSTQRATIGCIIPVSNGEESIAEVIEGLLSQSRVPDVIHVVVNNTTDRTVPCASAFAGPHEIVTAVGEQFTEVFVHDIGKNPDGKVGALNYGYALVEGYDYLLGVDGDTVAEAHAVEYLETEIIGDARIGGISAIYSIDSRPFTGLASFLISGQRSQLAVLNLQSLLRGRNMAVLGAQFSIFSTHALREVMGRNDRTTPWVGENAAGDSLLSVQIKSAGYLTKISPVARADVSGMTTLRDLDAQQVKRVYGAIEQMWPETRGDTSGQPLPPDLRSRRLEHVGMLSSLFVRIAFVALVVGSLSINALVLSPLWLIPVGVAAALKLRVAMSMKSRTRKDILFALLIVPAEMYTWIRLSHFTRAWARFLSRKTADDRAAHTTAEKGAALGHWTPLIAALGVLVALAVIWTMLGPGLQPTILWIGWLIVGVVVAVQTMIMLFRLLRRQHGYKV